jgi:hypothetical protein
MRIFLSSTAYDLSDLRAFTINLLEKSGHEVLFHESPTFPARVGLHSHDQCVEAVADSDLVICLIDRRYGGKYAGERIASIPDQKFSVLGSTKSGKRKKFEVVVPAKSLSITWIELITAHEKAIPVVTFARQRTLDEKETRRRNQFLASFMPAYAEKHELFDFLDWITKQKLNNWIAPFHSIVDYEQKLTTWMRELERTIATPKEDPEAVATERTRVCVIVEGEVDRMFVSYLVGKLDLHQQFVIIPTYGKYNVLNNFKAVVAQYGKIFEHVIVVLDSDAKTDTELEQNRRQLQSIIQDSGADNITSFFAHPSIEAWIAAGLVSDNAVSGPDLVTKDAFIQKFGQASINHVRNLLVHRFSYDRAMMNSHDFHNFVEFLLGLGGRGNS